MNEVIQSVLFLIRKQAETQEVSLVEEYDDRLPIVMADSEQMQQVILNIALNALQAIENKSGKAAVCGSGAFKPASQVCP